MKEDGTFKHVDIPQSCFEENIDKLIAFINRTCRSDSGTRDGMCEETTLRVKEFLDEKGFKCKIIEGEVEIGPKNHLVHRINIVPTGSDVWVIDFSSGQIPTLKNTEYLIKKLPNNYENVKEFLRKKYKWWFPD